ncbi:carboxymuconolactone decarboxylase family protein [Actinomadura sp. NAK00032]|uniref:carboxymuconolactone decarboxylase family protein n=1 Tax=Actinomadura sp. NAK00032 TaxID=2742128 RepID=UPI001591F8D6|nr:carboxymuconolactone decarboxylase family protein [Actinomadura sp. NAK00032]QKW39676.1 carboxymuconolactone decarboxylase family protein [Actinomadura sp. NAK00032]
MSASSVAEQDGPQSRLPNPARFVPELPEIAVAMSKAVENGSIPQTTITLVQLRLGHLVGSTYHVVQQSATLREAGEPEERITAVATWQDAPWFTDAERVALELVDAMLTPNPFGERVSDELYAKASGHYDDKALHTLCMAIGRSCFFVPLTLLGKPVPGREPGENWRE